MKNVFKNTDSVIIDTIDTLKDKHHYQSDKNDINDNNAKSILNIEVSCFKNYNSTASHPVNLLTWLKSAKYKKEVEAIRKESDKDQRDILKAQLPAITPSGLFTERNSRSITKHSGLISFDIDLKGNEAIGNYSELKEQVKKIKNVAYAGLSVSGRGLWGLIPISQPEKHNLQWLALEKSFSKIGIVIDPACKDVSRLRGYSYDPEGYFNHNAQTFTGIIQPSRPKRRHYSASGTDDKTNVESCINQLSFDITGDYQQWFGIGCSLANTFGEDGRDYFHAVSQYHSHYSATETDKQFTNCLKGKYQFGLGTFIHHCKLSGIEPERTKQAKPKNEYDMAGVLIDPAKGYPVSWDISQKPMEKMKAKNPLIQELIKRFDLIEISNE